MSQSSVVRAGGATRTERTRAQIREAAKELFLQHGFQGASTDAILAAAGIASKETLYRYYPKKEDLFVDVLRSLTVERPARRRFMMSSTGPTTPHELRAALRLIAQDVLENMMQPEYLALMRITLAELPRFPQLGEMFRQSVPARALDFLRTLLQAAQARGVVRPDQDLDTIARMFLGTLLTYAIFDGLLLTAHAPQMPEAHVVDTLVENVSTLVAVAER